MNELWPVMEHFRNGGEVDSRTHGLSFWEPSVKDPRWLDDRDYRISTAPRLVPLDAEDWLKGGPWWVRCGESDDMPCLVVRVSPENIAWCGIHGLVFRRHSEPDNLTDFQRRSGSDPDGKWSPCSKESKE